MSLRNHFSKIYGDEVVKNILELNSLEIKRNKQDLINFINKYKRIEENFEGTFKINGCKDCIYKDLAVRKQDFPGWLGQLKGKDLVIVGLEISPKVPSDIHISYNLGNIRNKIDMLLFKRIGLIYDNLEERAYITDLAKCLSTEVNKSRRECMKHFIKELKLIKNLNPDIKIIIQGYGAQQYFEKNWKLKISLEDPLYPLIRRGTIKLEDSIYQVIVFPHTTSRPPTNKLWVEIENKKVQIKNSLL